jgi:hypothetical protein
MKFCPCRECEVGIAVEAERELIIDELNEHLASLQRNGLTREANAVLNAIDYIKGENK